MADVVGAVLGVLVATWVVVVVLAMVITATALVWPRAHARLVPRPLRPWVALHPRRAAVLVAAPPAVAVGVQSAWFVVPGTGPGRSTGQYVQGLVIVALVLGGSVAAALGRAVLIGAREWSVQLLPVNRFAPPPSQVLVPPQRADDRPAALERPRAHLLDRRLRSSRRWLGAAGVGWYLLGRAAQVGGGDADPPAWWWAGTGALVVAGTAVWVSRRVRAPARTAPHQQALQAADVLARHGLAVRTPAGEWVRGLAPGAFLPAESVSGPSLWPWAATGQVSGCDLVVAVQHAQVRGRTGLTTAATRTACSVRIPGAQLPPLVVTGREGVPPSELHRAIELELEQFNRDLWVWGPSARGVYDVLHPRAMAQALSALPDGATLVAGGEHMAVTADEPVRAEALPAYVRFLGTMCQLVPTYLR